MYIKLHQITVTECNIRTKDIERHKYINKLL